MNGPVGIGEGHITARYRASVGLVVTNFIRSQGHACLAHEDIACRKQAAVLIVHRDAVCFKADVRVCREGGTDRGQPNYNQRQDAQYPVSQHLVLNSRTIG